jgi:hypothetical protein
MHSAESIFLVRKSAIFNFILLPGDKQDHLWPFFCYTVALAAVIKAETLVIRLRAVPKKLRAVMHSAEFFATFFVSTPRSDA